MNIRGIINGVVFGVTSLLPVSCLKQEAKDCWHSRENLLEEVMLDKPQAELNNINAKLPKGDAKIAGIQHVVDSIVFRDMFQGTQYIEDSAFISDYNKMIAKTKTPLTYGEFDGQNTADLYKLNEMIAENVTVREMKDITNSKILPENGGTGYLGTGKQYLLDSISHHKLFEKYNLLDKNGLKKFKNLCRKVRP